MSIYATVLVKKSYPFRGGPRGHFDVVEGRSYVLDFADAVEIISAGAAEPLAVECNGDDAKVAGLSMSKLNELHALLVVPAPVDEPTEPQPPADPVVDEE